MLAGEFLSLVERLHLPDYIGVEDFADKMSFLYSVLILLLCATVVTVKQYLMSPIACYIPTVPSGSDFDNFLENFCWVQGTIPFLPGEEIPQTMDEWEYYDQTYRINYYQWVPLMFGVQCTLFYLPRLIWQSICSNRTGTDIEHLVSIAHQASTASPCDRQKLVTHVAASIRGMLFQHREYRRNKLIDARNRLFDSCGILIASKRLGTWLAFTYIIIKTMYLVNSVGQMYLMQHFLGFNASLSNFGLEIAKYISSGRNWDETRIFPRVSYCFIADLRQLGSKNRYVAQCVLPVNMLNEKLYIFLWYWTALVAISTAVSIPLWLFRLTLTKHRLRFVKKFLRINEQYRKSDRPVLKKFTEEYLKHDGVFLLRMISMNAGDVIVSQVIAELWTGFCKQCETPKILGDNFHPMPALPQPSAPQLADPPYPKSFTNGVDTSSDKKSVFV